MKLEDRVVFVTGGAKRIGKAMAVGLARRELADRRIYPAIDLPASATRKEELLLDDDALWGMDYFVKGVVGTMPKSE